MLLKQISGLTAKKSGCWKHEIPIRQNSQTLTPQKLKIIYFCMFESSLLLALLTRPQLVPSLIPLLGHVVGRTKKLATSRSTKARLHVPCAFFRLNPTLYGAGKHTKLDSKNKSPVQGVLYLFWVCS